MGSKSRLVLFSLFSAFLFTIPNVSVASDHDDGETDQKGRSLNLTDLYAFREDWQTTGGSNGNLVLIMNTNPRSLPKQQYFFSTNARYDFHVTRVGTAASGKTTRPNGRDDVVIRFKFGSPETTSTSTNYNTQPITVTTIHDGVSDGSTTTNADGSTILTTSLANSSANTLTSNSFQLGGATFTLFAGMRQDPFFFDVNRYFQIRGSLAASSGTSAAPGFASGPTTAADFTTGYNVNAIVLKVPIAFLQKSAETVFDVWETISLLQ